MTRSSELVRLVIVAAFVADIRLVRGQVTMGFRLTNCVELERCLNDHWYNNTICRCTQSEYNDRNDWLTCLGDRGIENR